MKQQHVLTVLSAPVLLVLVLASVIGLGLSASTSHAALAWDGGWGGWHSGWYGWHASHWYQPVGCGNCNHQFGFGAWNLGYNAGYTDFSTNNQYDCGYNHSLTYCNGYLAGWNDAQGQNQNQQTDASTDQDQGQQQDSTSTSTSYAQANPNVHVTVNNIVPGVGTGNTGEGSGYQGQDPK